jgi:hypothetical protein
MAREVRERCPPIRDVGRLLQKSHIAAHENDPAEEVARGNVPAAAATAADEDFSDTGPQR